MNSKKSMTFRVRNTNDQWKVFLNFSRRNLLQLTPHHFLTLKITLNSEIGALALLCHRWNLHPKLLQPTYHLKLLRCIDQSFTMFHYLKQK